MAKLCAASNQSTFLCYNCGHVHVHVWVCGYIFTLLLFSLSVQSHGTCTSMPFMYLNGHALNDAILHVSDFKLILQPSSYHSVVVHCSCPSLLLLYHMPGLTCADRSSVQWKHATSSLEAGPALFSVQIPISCLAQKCICGHDHSTPTNLGPVHDTWPPWSVHPCVVLAYSS